VHAVLEHLRKEFALAMALSGRSSLDQIDRSMVQRA
jgi:isopentenyl diphosphate isomerase/L-lactate dehydrogenase-like FMN-dependent dehydrogenase